MAGLLHGRVCVITGCSSGIGSSIAQRYAKEGAALVLVSRKKELLQQIADQCSTQYGVKCTIYATDLLDSKAVDAVCAAILTDHGRVDVLVNNAGMFTPGTPLQGEPDEWEKMLALNVNCPMRMTRRFAPAMAERKSGTIINIGSTAAIQAMADFPAYATTKHALRGWSRSCYQALRNSNVKVVLINPDLVNTPMVNTMPNLIPERMLKPDDIAEVAMLPFKVGSTCVPEEVNVNLTLSAYK